MSSSLLVQIQRLFISGYDILLFQSVKILVFSFCVKYLNSFVVFYSVNYADQAKSAAVSPLMVPVNSLIFNTHKIRFSNAVLAGLPDNFFAYNIMQPVLSSVSPGM